MLNDYMVFYKSGSQLVDLDPQEGHKINVRGVCKMIEGIGIKTILLLHKLHNFLYFLSVFF